MNKYKLRATARVQVTIEVEEATWGEDCSIGQLYDQAATAAVSKIRRLITSSDIPAKVIGNPKVLGIITEDV